MSVLALLIYLVCVLFCSVLFCQHSLLFPGDRVFLRTQTLATLLSLPSTTVLQRPSHPLQQSSCLCHPQQRYRCAQPPPLATLLSLPSMTELRWAQPHKAFAMVLEFRS